MRLSLLLVVFFFYSCKYKRASEREKTIAENGLSAIDCVYRIPEKGIRETWPFSQSDSIVLVSFKGSGRIPLALENGKLRHPEFTKILKLNPEQKAALFKILFHYSQKDQNEIPAVKDCYEPHHAIIFYEADKAMAFYEICFECLNRRVSEYMGDWCNEKPEMLEEFFKKAGIDVG